MSECAAFGSVKRPSWVEAIPLWVTICKGLMLFTRLTPSFSGIPYSSPHFAKIDLGSNRLCRIIHGYFLFIVGTSLRQDSGSIFSMLIFRTGESPP